MANQIVWVDIPVVDLQRAMKFYAAVLGVPLSKESVPGIDMAVLPHEDNGVGACLFRKSGERPAEYGPLIYLNAQGHLDQAVSAAESNGGRVLEAKHAIGPHGYRAIVRDSEGNRIALHSM